MAVTQKQVGMWMVSGGNSEDGVLLKQKQMMVIFIAEKQKQAIVIMMAEKQKHVGMGMIAN